MGIINLENISPGMILAANVQERSGRILISSGTEITEKHLHILRTWGVTEADIQGASKEDLEAQALSQIDPVLIRKVEEQAKSLFRHLDPQDAVVRELYRLYTMSKFKEAAILEVKGNGL
jgi:hypothetical protein